MNWRTGRANGCLTLLAFVLGPICLASAQSTQTPLVTTTTVPLQPFALQVRQIESALEYLGQPLSSAEQQEINDAIADSDDSAAVGRTEQILDRHTIAIVDINPESRVQVRPGSAKPELVELGTW